jgi:hypothetical protein
MPPPQDLGVFFYLCISSSYNVHPGSWCLKIAGYVHQGILSQGPCFNYSWLGIVAQLLRGLRRAGDECVVILGSRLPQWARENADRDLLKGLRVVELDEVSLFRQLSALGVMPAAFNKLAYEAHGSDHPALRVVAEEIVRGCGGFEPDVLISFGLHTEFLAPYWPQTLRLHTEGGPYSRNPFPVGIFFDHFGLYGRSVLNQVGTSLQDVSGTADGRGLVAEFRRQNGAALQAVDPFRDINFRERFDRLCLLPLQVSNRYSFDEQAPYRTQFEYLLDVLSAAPSDVGVIVSEHVLWERVLKNVGPEENLEYLRKTFPNMIFHEQFRHYASSSQFLVPRVDGIWSVSSNVGYQALLFERMLGSPASSHFAGLAHATNFADFFAKLGRESAGSRDALLAWQFENYLVPNTFWSDGQWLHDYLERRRQAAGATSDPIKAFVRVADTARLEKAWIGHAPNPVAEPFRCLETVDGLEAAYKSILRSRSWRLTAPLRAGTQLIGALDSKLRKKWKARSPNPVSISETNHRPVASVTAPQPTRGALGSW